MSLKNHSPHILFGLCPGADCPQLQHHPGHGQQGAQSEGPGRHQHQHAGGVLGLHFGQAQHLDGPGGGGAVSMMIKHQDRQDRHP